MKNGRPAPPRVVVAEPFAESGIAVLRDRGIDVVSCVGRSAADLRAALADADGLIVRSETRVDRSLLAAGPRLTVVARAGVGVDAIDVPAATEAGIVVLNAPAGNTLSAVELTFAHMLSLARHVPQAVAALRAGIWDRKPLIGHELAGKTLGIVGLGRIGGNVAMRASAFGMRLLAHDPYISAARADSLGAELIDLEALLARSDIVTLHVPLNAQTLGMIDAPKLALMQPHAYIVNCARGGVIDETALFDALERGTIAAAGIDVVAVEPPPADGIGAKLHRHPRVIATPHIGGSTYEALERIATDIASDVAAVLLGGMASSAVNAPDAEQGDIEELRPYLDVAYRIGRLYPQLATSPTLPALRLVMEGAIADLPPDALVTGFLCGLLQAVSDRRITVVNARAVADELGVRVETGRAPQTQFGASAVRVVGGATSIVGTHAYGGPRIIAIDGYEIDAVPSGSMLVTKHRDVPGMVGRVGTILGSADINISAMQVSRARSGGDAIMILSIDRPADANTIERIRALDGIERALVLSLPPIASAS